MPTETKALPTQAFSSATLRSTDMKRWSTPMPPLPAMKLAMADSVTVSMLAVISGSLRVSLPVRSVTEVSTCCRDS